MQDCTQQLGQYCLIMLEIAVDHGHYRGDRGKKTLCHGGCQSAAANPSDKADARIGQGDLFDQRRGTISRTVIDENDLGVDAHQSDTHLGEKRFYIIVFIQDRDNHSHFKLRLCTHKILRSETIHCLCPVPLAAFPQQG